MKQRIVNVWAALSFIGIVTMAIVVLVMWSHSFNSRAKPSELEASVAIKAHDSSIPDRYETMKSPLATEGINLVEAGGTMRSTVPPAMETAATESRSSTG